MAPQPEPRWLQNLGDDAAACVRDADPQCRCTPAATGSRLEDTSNIRCTWGRFDNAMKLSIDSLCTTFLKFSIRQDAQLSQRDRAAGCVTVFAKSRRVELGDNILRTLWVYLQPLWWNRPENLSNSVKKTQN